MLADSDVLSDRIAARLEREGPDADFERILEEELERRRLERNDPPPTAEQEAEWACWIEEANRAAEPSTDDPELLELCSRHHPLAVRAQHLFLRLATEPEKRGWIGEGSQREHPVAALIEATMCAAGKLAGALNGREWPPERRECGMALARLKRTRSYLDDAQLAADTCAADSLTEASWLAEIRSEIAAIATGVDETIADLRGRLGRGFD